MGAHPLGYLGWLLMTLAVAHGAGELARRRGFSPVAAELLAGVAGGLWFSQLGHIPEGMRVLGGAAAFVLLFEAGLALDRVRLRGAAASALVRALTAGGLSFALCYGAALWMGRGGASGLLAAAALSSASGAVVSRALADREAFSSPDAAGLVQAALLVQFLFLSLSAAVAASLPIPGTYAEVAGRTLLGVLTAAAALLAGPELGRFLSRLVSSWGVPAGRLLPAAFLAAGFAWALGLAGLPAVFGAFLAGSAVSGTPEGSDLGEALRPARVLLVPCFFLLIGVELGATALPWIAAGGAGVVLLAVLLLGASTAGKMAGCLVGAALPSGRWAGGLGLLPQGETALVLAQAVLAVHPMDTALYAATLLAAAAATVLGPLLLARSLPAPGAR